MRVHLLAGRGARARRVALVAPVIVALAAFLGPGTSVAAGAHAKRHHKKHGPSRRHHGPLPGHGRLRSHGQVLRLALLNTNHSSNWFGYNQGTLEKGGKLFSSIAGDWIVPTATQHTKGQAESSSDWIGIGGGCVDSGCNITDSTLIQTGTEQDVSSSGQAAYSAGWEGVPAPSITISMKVAPGDHMHASISQAAPELWTIKLQDLTRNESFSMNVPYSSTQDTAEWIEETPLVLGTNAGFAALPKLTTAPFTSAQTNGAPAGLVVPEELDLVDSSGKVIGAPSAPKSSGTAFDACAWAATCS
jgi:hypothetical protein